jgi:hypothetical protein
MLAFEIDLILARCGGSQLPIWDTLVFEIDLVA